MQVSSLLSRREGEHDHDHSCGSCDHGHDHTHAVLPLKQTLLGLVLVLNSYFVQWCFGKSAEAVVAASAMAGALVLAELSPFRFAHGGNFSWLPFRSLFRSNWQDGLVNLFRKSFWYGSVIWLWRTAGHRLLVTTGAVAVALLLLERLQVYLPGRTPEATDAVMAVIMGLLIWQLRDV